MSSLPELRVKTLPQSSSSRTESDREYTATGATMGPEPPSPEPLIQHPTLFPIAPLHESQVDSARQVYQVIPVSLILDISRVCIGQLTIQTTRSIQYVQNTAYGPHVVFSSTLQFEKAYVDS